MAQDYGIIITDPGIGVGGASKSQVAMNTSYPFLKLDTQKPNSFQSILLLLVDDPPEPPSGTLHAYTVVYKFKHGYSYIPAIETLFYVKTPPPGASYSTPYFLDWTILGAHSVGDYAALYAVADNTWVYFVVDKYKDTGFFGQPNLLTGTTVQISTHVFLDGIGI